MSFNIGDRVAVTDLGKASQNDFGVEIKIGYKGTIIDFTKVIRPLNPDETIRFLVEFDEPMGGHDGNDFGKISGKSGHCWWMRGNQDSNLIKWRDNRDCGAPLICKKIMKKRKNNFY